MRDRINFTHAYYSAANRAIKDFFKKCACGKSNPEQVDPSVSERVGKQMAQYAQNMINELSTLATEIERVGLASLLLRGGIFGNSSIESMDWQEERAYMEDLIQKHPQHWNLIRRYFELVRTIISSGIGFLFANCLELKEVERLSRALITITHSPEDIEKFLKDMKQCFS